MKSKITFAWLSDKYIEVLLLLSILMIGQVEIAGFPLYSLLLFLVVFSSLTVKIYSGQKKGTVFFPIRFWEDIAAIVAIGYALLNAVGKLFRNPEEGKIDFATNAVVIAFAVLYFLISSGVFFKRMYFDVILYSGLFMMGALLLPYFTNLKTEEWMGGFVADYGAMASYLLLIDMISVYAYCTCKDKLRSLFYLLVSAVGFFLLFLNGNVISFWLLTIYFLAIPIVLWPTAWLIKNAMQLFFLYGFMLSNMSLFVQSTKILQKELSYSLEHSIYLDLLLAIGGIVFFHYWERIPEGIDMERLVMRKMQKGYQFLLKIVLIFFTGMVIGADRWTAFPDGITGEFFMGFALPLTESMKQNVSGFYFCFQHIGIAGGIFVVCICALLIGRLRRNYQIDKPVTGILILISTIFMVQLLFWKPAVSTLTVYFILLIFAAFYQEERVEVTSVKIKMQKDFKKVEKETGNA